MKYSFVHEGYMADLTAGQENRVSADVRRKEAYRMELEKQMAEDKATKQRLVEIS